MQNRVDDQGDMATRILLPLTALEACRLEDVFYRVAKECDLTQAERNLVHDLRCYIEQQLTPESAA